MPEELDRCVKSLIDKGYSKNSAFAICSKSTGWKRAKGGGWVKRKEENLEVWVSPYEAMSKDELFDYLNNKFPGVEFDIDSSLFESDCGDNEDAWYHIIISEAKDLEAIIDKLSENFAVIVEKVPEDVLAWRRRQKPGKIMKPSTFKEIEKKAREAGYDDPKAVAGAAYWKTVKAKYRKAKAKKKGKK